MAVEVKLAQSAFRRREAMDPWGLGALLGPFLAASLQEFCPAGVLQTGLGEEIFSYGFRRHQTSRGCVSREAKCNSSESQPCNYSSNNSYNF